MAFEKEYGMSPIVELTNVSVPGRLLPLNLTIDQPKMIAIVGPNGSGKSTLLQAMSGLIDAQGIVAWNGVPLKSIPVLQRAHTFSWVGTETLFQFPFTVEEVVRMGRFAFSDQEINEEIFSWLDLKEITKREVTRISSGERQRTVLARALATECTVQLWDEPLAQLDIRHQLEVLKLGRTLVDQNNTIFFSVHDLRIAHCMDLVIVLNYGKLEGFGPPESVLTPQVIERVFGVQSTLLPSMVLSLPR